MGCARKSRWPCGTMTTSPSADRVESCPTMACRPSRGHGRAGFDPVSGQAMCGPGRGLCPLAARHMVPICRIARRLISTPKISEKMSPCGEVRHSAQVGRHVNRAMTSCPRHVDVTMASRRRHVDVKTTSCRSVDITSTSRQRHDDVTSTSRWRHVDVTSTSRRRPANVTMASR